MRRRGSVLILVLWLIIVLGVIALAYTSSVNTQLQIASQGRNRREAYWAARAGIEKARAILAATELKVVAYDRAPLLVPDQYNDQEIGDAKYTIWVGDECGRVNINVVDDNTMILLPALSQERADSVIDWRDSNNYARRQGAEAQYYQELKVPYMPRNAPLRSVRELMRVRGWDQIFNTAFPDPYQRYSLDADPPPETSTDDETTLNADDARRLLDNITVWSAPLDQLAPDEQPKIDLNRTSVEVLKSRAQLSTEEANAVVAYPKAHPNVRLPLELLEVTAPVTTEQKPRGSSTRKIGDTGTISGSASRSQRSTPSGAAGPRTSTPISSITSSSGSRTSSKTSSSSSASTAASSTSVATYKIFTLDRVGQIIDYFKGADSPVASSSSSTPSGTPPLNLNTVNVEGLMTLPGMTDDLAHAIVEQRGTQPFEAPGMVASVPGMTESVFRKIYPLLSVTSSRFRIVSTGHSGEGTGNDATVTLEVVVDVSKQGVQTLYWREG